MATALDYLNRKLDASKEPLIDAPQVDSFREFLEKCAKVRAGSRYVDYHFQGREILGFIVDLIDIVLGTDPTREVQYRTPDGRLHTLCNPDEAPMQDAEVNVGGGAQFGKTVLELNLAAYLTSREFRNVGMFLPDDDLVQGIVDTKFRPDVIDQIPWFARMISVGKAINESGRAVNRKGAFMVTDGDQTAQGYIRGMGKIPTSFSMDVVMQDEKDDIPDKTAKFLSGRMTASDMRIGFSFGTQRYHGAGQNREVEDGCKFVQVMSCPGCGHRHNAEEDWPGICRVALDGRPRPEDPRLTDTGTFKQPGSEQIEAEFSHTHHYYFACTRCGRELDRGRFEVEARNPEKIAARNFSIRVSQMGIAAIPVKMIVADWCESAVKDPDAMKAFSCDRRAIPRSTAQALTPEIIERSRRIETYYPSLAETPHPIYAGLDTGDRCWFAAREIETPLVKRSKWLEELAAENVRTRVPQLFEQLNISCLFVDAGPLRDLARDLAWIINGIQDQNISIDDPQHARIDFGGGLVWDGERQIWRGMKCACVEFTQREGQGVRHKLGITQSGKYYPLIAACRNETIEAVLNELLTPEEGVLEVIDNQARTEPAWRLPDNAAGAPPVVDVFDRHLLVGSKVVPSNDGKRIDYVDQVENHFLLAAAYSRLAETLAAATAPRKVHSSNVTESNRRGGFWNRRIRRNRTRNGVIA